MCTGALTRRFDERVRELLDFSIYLDISDDVKFAWKIQV
jgi:phosphoribulokinase